MTDLAKLKQLLDSWGVPHNPYEENVLKVGGCTHQADPRETVNGYKGFYTLYSFDADGKFICMGAWE